MAMRSGALGDGTDLGTDAVDVGPGAPDDRLFVPGAVGDGSSGGGSSGTGDGPPAGTAEPFEGSGGGAGPAPPQSPPPGATATFGADGNLTSYTVTDVGDTQPWSSFRSYYDLQGNVLAQIGLNDGGSFWVNVYDPGGQGRVDHYTDVYDAAGRLVSHSQTNPDGTHMLTVNDTTGSQTWSTFTMTFDPGWNQTSLTGTNHDGTHGIDANAIQTFMDTLTWYANPRVVDGATPPTDRRGPLADFPALLAPADPRAADPFAALLNALPQGVAVENGRGGDPLAAFLASLSGFSGDAGVGGTGSSRSSGTLLSNGFNADAGVAQLVSALAGLVDSSSAFNATPFERSSDPNPPGVIAAALP